MRTIGILGGMGPEATILLMQKVLAAVPARDDGDHIPLIVHQNPQVPSRIAALIEGTGDSPAPVLAAMARGLKAAGAQALAMPCNTAHAYKDAVRTEGVAFLDMTEAAAARVQGRVGMLASPAVRMAGVFDAGFAAHGLTPVWPEDEAAVLDLIRAVKAGRSGSSEARALARIGRELLRRSDMLLVACTELSMLTGGLAGLVWVDALDCLVDEIVAFARG